ncbi:hypothetical protein INR49_026238 [Caranx melampygus]|nr:hypothetical protein INR49_026238 [Caranx melampygus]
MLNKNSLCKSSMTQICSLELFFFAVVYISVFSRREFVVVVVAVVVSSSLTNPPLSVTGIITFSVRRMIDWPYGSFNK